MFVCPSPHDIFPCIQTCTYIHVQSYPREYEQTCTYIHFPYYAREYDMHWEETPYLGDCKLFRMHKTSSHGTFSFTPVWGGAGSKNRLLQSRLHLMWRRPLGVDYQETNRSKTLAYLSYPSDSTATTHTLTFTYSTGEIKLCIAGPRFFN